ncbi:hypothetical protein HLH33_18655 [Gluconacetobacter diazotrophicus]|uniref:Uncharacterized protein n=1 Tax=Gluconacetobacter diazotrophicus TaxID=33996 RepID=A0A7W4I8J4_GLUDI|nr:hypothetical protein [Gluconacetobacter diazotrophicus]MBB2158286.1 hypothetical protein [Gluconacetobacter diazotrophicus]
MNTPTEDGIQALAAPDWMRTVLTISGPAEPVAGFRATARGPGIIPWVIDWDYEEARLLAPMASEGPAARTLARLLREAAQARAERARDPGVTGGCPFDLHRLVPVPTRILQLGDDSAAARRWLWEHWGTTWPLRQVELVEAGDRRRRRSARITVSFVSADWTPWAALRQIRADWPALDIAIRPGGDGG